jgi:hypothetical protein
MTICATLLDAMPDVASGRRAWAKAEAEHLASCPECRENWDLIQRAARLGAEFKVEPDPAATAARVVARVAAARRASRRAWVSVGLAAAAAVVLVLWQYRRPPAPAPVAEAPRFVIPVAELDDLNGRQLTRVLEGMETPVSVPGPLDLPSFGELDDQELSNVLSSMEG